MIHVANGRDGYKKILNTVIDEGRPITARDQLTHDLGYTLIVLDEPEEALPIGIGRNLDPRIAAVEAIQLIGGFYDHELVERQAPRLLKYADRHGYMIDHMTNEKTDIMRLHGAYGARIGNQLPQVIEKIKRDRETRQAVITLWDPWLDNLPEKHDYPCTVMMQFRVYQSKLEMNVIMRSNDAWLGLPYDMFQFTQLHLTVARILELAPGPYHHTALSLHIYERNVDTARQLIESTPLLSGRMYQPSGIGRTGDTVSQVRERCRALATNGTLAGMTVSEGWYGEYLTAQLTPHMG